MNYYDYLVKQGFVTVDGNYIDGTGLSVEEGYVDVGYIDESQLSLHEQEYTIDDSTIIYIALVFAIASFIISIKNNNS